MASGDYDDDDKDADDIWDAIDERMDGRRKPVDSFENHRRRRITVETCWDFDTYC